MSLDFLVTASERIVFQYLQMKILNVCVVLIWSFCILNAGSRRPTCPQLTHFTIFYPSNPDAKETCRICPKCPPGYGLPVQCGSRVSNITSTDCEQCIENKTYSEKNDISECKSCNDCTGRNVLQMCSKLNNSKCGTCLPEYYSVDEVDDCKKCSFCCKDALEHEHLRQCKALGMPRHMQCEDTDKNRKCEIQALLLSSTTTTTSRPLVTVLPTSKPGQTSGSGVTTTGIPSEGTEVKSIRKSVAAPSDSSHNRYEIMYGLVGVLSVLVLGAIMCAVKLKTGNGSRNRHRIGRIYNSIGQGNILLHFLYVYLYPSLCAALGWAQYSGPQQLNSVPAKDARIGLLVAICMSTKSLIYRKPILNLKKQHRLLELVIWKSTVRLGKRRRESGLNFSGKTNPKIGFVHQKFIFRLSSYRKLKSARIRLLAPLHLVTSTVFYVPLASKIFTYLRFYPHLES